MTVVAVGDYYALALKNDGTVVAWGGDPQIFQPNLIPNLQLNAASGLTNVTAIAADPAGDHWLVLKGDGTVQEFGDTTNNCSAPLPPVQMGPLAAQAAGGATVTAIAAGTCHSLALLSDGTVRTWGENRLGQLDVPPGLTNVVAIAAGGSVSVALKSDGTLVAWGGTHLNPFDPFIPPPTLRGVSAVAVGIDVGLAIVPPNLVPVLTAISPTSAPLSATGVTLTITGSGFVDGAQVLWNGVALPTTFVSATQLTASVPSANLATAGAQSIAVLNPAPGGGTSATLPFVVTDQATHLQVTAPAAAKVGVPFDVTVAALDGANNPAVGYTGTVQFTSSDTAAGVVLPAAYTFTAADNGSHTFTNAVALKTAGAQAVSATDTTTPTITGTSAAIDVAAAPPTGSAAISLQPATGSVTVGTSATLSVQAAIATTSLGAWTVDVTYDPTLLKPTGCTSDPAVGSVCNTAFSPTTVRLKGASSSGLTGTQALASLTFQAIGGAGTTTTLSPTVVTLADTLGNPMTSTTASGQVSITAHTTTTLASSANPSVFGQPVTFTAAVASGTTPVTSGSVTFLEGTTVLGGPTPLDAAGHATFSSAALAVGSHTLTARYGGSSAFNPSSGTLTQTVNRASTTTTVSSSLNPSVFGQAVTFTVGVTPVAPVAGTPTGSVTLLDGTTALGTASLANGSAQVTTSALTAGPHSLTATYAGDTSFSGSTSAPLAQTVTRATSTTTVSSSKNPSNLGEAVTFTAQVTPGAATGTVQFQIDGVALGTPVTMSGGSAVSAPTTTLNLGNHVVTAIYSGDSNVAGSTGTLSGGQQVNGILGDTNLDGKVDAVDALCILRSVAGLPSTLACPPAPATVLDVNGTGSVDAVDALCVLRAVTGLPVTATCPLPPIPASAAPTAATTTAPAAAAPATATGGGTGYPLVGIQPNRVNLAAGSSTTVQVQAETTEGLGAWTVDVIYDPTVVKVTGCTATAANALCNATFASNTIRLTGVSVSGLTGTQTLANITFTAVASKGSSSAVSVGLRTFANATGAPIKATTVDGRIRIK